MAINNHFWQLTIGLRSDSSKKEQKISVADSKKNELYNLKYILKDNLLLLLKQKKVISV